MSWRWLVLIFIGTLISVGLIVFAKPLAQWLLTSFGVEESSSRPQVAEIIETSGPAYYRPGSRGRYVRVKTDLILRQRDEVKTERDGRIHIKFNSGYEIEVLEESQAIMDIWSSSGDRRPEYISFLRGDFRLLSRGEPGLFYVVLGNQVFAPENRPESRKRAYKIDPSLQVAPEEKDPEPIPDKVVKEETKIPKDKNRLGKGLPDKLAEGDKETLSSAYIESVFTSRAALFRRCQLTSLRDYKPATGNLLFSLTIQPNGQVRKIKVLQKTVDNPSFENCVSSVIERTKFRSFSGAAISLSYPLNFQ